MDLGRRHVDHLPGTDVTAEAPDKVHTPGAVLDGALDVVRVGPPDPRGARNGGPGGLDPLPVPRNPVWVPVTDWAISLWRPFRTLIPRLWRTARPVTRLRWAVPDRTRDDHEPWNKEVPRPLCFLCVQVTRPFVRELLFLPLFPRGNDRRRLLTFRKSGPEKTWLYLN